MIASTLGAALALALAAAPAKDEDALEAKRAAIAKQVVRLAPALQREIEAVDVRALLARVPAEGLRCAGRVVPRARLERDLRSEASWLHGVLFGGPGAVAAPGQPASLRALFAAAKELQVVVAFREDARSAVGLPCLDFRARDTVTPGAPFCFEERKGRWWIVESFYPC